MAGHNWYEGGQQFNSSMCNSKLIGVRYFNAALKRKFRSSNVDSARDTTGHGTYVSSVVAGNFLKWVSFDGYAEGTTKGVAPYARISMYKVVWDGGIRCSKVFAGMDQAIADGVDVICLPWDTSKPQKSYHWNLSQKPHSLPLRRAYLSQQLQEIPDHILEVYQMGCHGS